jgi:hypothetical protein
MNCSRAFRPLVSCVFRARDSFGERGNTGARDSERRETREHGIRREGKQGGWRERKNGRRRNGREDGVTLYTLEAKLFGEQKRVTKRTRDDEKKYREGATENDPSEKNNV